MKTWMLVLAMSVAGCGGGAAGGDAANTDECSGQHTVGKVGEACVAASTGCAICGSGLVCDATHSINGIFGTCVPVCADGGATEGCCAAVAPDEPWCAVP